MNPDDARAATQIVERSAKNQEKARGKPEEKREEGKTRTKKKRAWSPLKTTRYGVSARRPKEEPADETYETPVTAPARMPLRRASA
ncbi:hypothetical protein PT2222_10028 [Paraburkholderia tropica]